MSDLLVRIRVLATSALTYLTAVSAILVALAQQLEGVAGVPEWLTRTLASVIAVIGVVILQVRRVTPVAPQDQGLLPPKGPAVEVVANNPRDDAGAVTLSLLFLVVALVCFVVFALIAHGTFNTDEGFTWLGAGLTSATLAKLVP